MLFVCDSTQVDGRKGNVSPGIVRAAAWYGWMWLLLHRGQGFTAEEEPSVSLQTPPRVAHFKCSLISSAATNTGPQGKLKKQMEASRGEGRRGESQKRGRGILRIERGNFVRNNH